MLTDAKILGKLDRIELRYQDLRYESVADVPVEMYETQERLRAAPRGSAKVAWLPAPAGTAWGDSFGTAWFRGRVRLPKAVVGQKVFVRAATGGETLFIVDGEYRGVFDGNHPAVLMTARGEAGHVYEVNFEAYAGHSFPGCAPDEKGEVVGPKARVFGGVQILRMREDVVGFVHDLRVLLQLAGRDEGNSLEKNSLRRNRIIRGLADVFAAVDAMPQESGEASWRPKLAKARQIMWPLLAAKNGPTAPWFGIIGHSHIDTAWLWPIAETWRKCARTFSSVINLMEQYPEFMFTQSAPCHADMMRREYPGLFKRIQAMVKRGRWEPNGAMWVEPDCNIPSGESFVRQLLVGQAATREMFGYTSDTLWLPDVFGYSAALPQILAQSGIRFFCTTKINWNDTTKFPYDTFHWKGVDGTSVLAHFHYIHFVPDPVNLIWQWNQVQHKDIQDRRLAPFGFGDGGGGPTAEMCEFARRVEDLEGCPRARYMTVSEFMQGIRRDMGADLPEWVGELYMEGHRGTLTSIAGVKRRNRLAEFALREAEYLSTLAALSGAAYPADELKTAWKILLTNQFHDILPGSSIAEVNDEAVRDLDDCTGKAGAVSQAALQRLAGPSSAEGKSLRLVNSLSWDRAGELVLDAPRRNLKPASPDLVSQRIEDVDGASKLVLSGVTVPALGSTVIPMVAGASGGASAFTVSATGVETPHATVKFDKAGRMTSFVDKASGRQIVKSGGALNALLIGEDVPEAWDSWDIDSDQRLKMRAEDRLVRRAVVADGPLQLRIRSEYRLGAGSSLTQDLVFHAGSPRVDFETVVDWNERHQLLKAGFDLDVLADSARQEIQYGHLERSTHRNQPQDRARFEACAHKWTDLSENGFGVALLNDCKYGMGVQGGTLRLSLLKAGTHPDARGDRGRHRFTYSLLPHACGFSVESVVRPAYELNLPVTAWWGSADALPWASLLTVDAPHVIVESVKWAEQGKAFVVRLYEAGKTGGRVKVTFNAKISSVSATNLLEEDARPLKLSGGAVRFTMRPFEIKTLLVRPEPASR